MSMRKFVIAATCVALAGCGSSEVETPEAEAENAEAQEFTLDSTAMGNIALTYEVKLADGSVTMQTINPDGRPMSTRQPTGPARVAEHGVPPQKVRCASTPRATKARNASPAVRPARMEPSNCRAKTLTVQSVRKVERPEEDDVLPIVVLGRWAERPPRTQMDTERAA